MSLCDAEESTTETEESSDFYSSLEGSSEEESGSETGECPRICII